MLLLFGILTIIGCLSPLLTFLALFQQKEWRLDRLGEHLRREGAIRQLWGWVRPVMVVLFVITDIFFVFMVRNATNSNEAAQLAMLLLVAHAAWLLLFAGMTGLQLILRKQRSPVWTSKAKLMAVIAGMLDIAATSIWLFSIYSPAVILLAQPLIVLIAWAALLPLDRYLKAQWFARARAVRDTWKDSIVIGIAGSVGKTTTKELIKHLLSDLHPITTPAHVNTEMGVAQWMVTESRKMKAERSPVIVEMGAYKKGEIALMCTFVKPTIGVMTALGSDHLALFGSEDAITEANAELLHALPKSGHAFLYADNNAVRSLVSTLDCHVTLAGLHKDADIRVEKITETDKGLTAHLEDTTCTVALHGMHNVGNILLAVGIAKKLGISDERIRELLESFQPLAHTFNVRTEHGIRIVDDTYNSSLLSIRAALDWAKSQNEHPRILLMSGLLETGNQEEAFLKELGAAAKGSIERVIFTADTGRTAFEETYGKPVEILSSHSTPAPTGSLLLCLGRMPLSAIQKLLSKSPITHNP